MYLENVAAAIDYLLTRVKPGTTGAAARAICLQYLQAAEGALWTSGAWWFRQRESALALTAGEALYSVEGLSNVVSLQQDGALPAERVSVVEFDAVFSGDVAGGDTVRFWCERPLSSQGLVQVQVWPAPLSNGSAVVTGDVVLTALEDSDTSVLSFPLEWRDLVVLSAEEKLAQLDGQLDYAAQVRGARDGRLGELRVANAGRPMQA